MKNIYKILFYLFGIAGVVLFYYFYPVIFPEINIQFKLNAESAKDLAIKEIYNLGYDTSNYVFVVQPNINSKFAKILHHKYGISQGNKMLKAFDYAYFNVYASIPPKKSDQSSMRISNDDKESINQNSNIPSFSMNVSSSGKIFYFKRTIPDTMYAENADSSVIHENCIKMLKKYFPDFSINSEHIDYRKNFKRNDLKYTFQGIDKNNFNMTIDIVVNGSKIGLIKKQYAFEKFEADIKTDMDIIKTIEIVQVILIIIMFILMVFWVINRYKNDEISLKYSTIFACVFASLFTINIVLSMMNDFHGSEGLMLILISAIFIFLLFGAFFFIIIAGTDSISRLSWNEKFHSYDACRKGFLFSSKVQDSFFNGLAVSGIYLLFIPLFYLTVENVFHLEYSYNYNPESTRSLLEDASIFGSLSFLTRTFTTSFFYILSFPVLTIALLKKRFKNDYLVLGFALIIITIIDFPSVSKPDSIVALFIFNLLFGILLISAFYKFDVLALLWSYFLFEVIRKIIFLSYISVEYSNTSLIVLCSLLAALFLLFLLPKLFKKRQVIDYEELSPKFVKRISERERISKEIEAARHIQKSFLPYNTPNFTGLEVAANCIPALEVGGDYYDYFVLDENRLGVVIADVSGKGLKAAFYMTLIKGIIKAQTQTYISPKEVVSKLNKLLYEIIEKGNFVSLIYGVFDIENKYFIFSNAGHNPIIMKQITHGKISYDKNEGMALGLSEESIFNNNVFEKIISFRPGDLFILYTDGFTEAMNKSKIEFGPDAFLELISRFSNDSPSEIIKKTEIEVKNYIGKAQQHDDMTMVAVRIK